jgi:hypothetical protein
MKYNDLYLQNGNTGSLDINFFYKFDKKFERDFKKMLRKDWS